MGRTACTEPQCLYKGAFYLHKALNLISIFFSLFTKNFDNCIPYCTGWHPATLYC